MNKKLRLSMLTMLVALFSTVGMAQTTIFSESFDKCEGKGGNDDKFSGITGNKNLSDELTDNAGWSGTLVNGANKCVSIGTSSKLGSLTTPELSGLNGNATLTFRASAWKSDDTSISISIDGGGSLNMETVELKNAEFQEYTVSISGGTATSKITFAGSKAKNRFFIDDVKIVSASAPTGLAAPVIEGDAEFVGKTKVTITGEEGTVIYWTLDGTEPNSDSERMVSPASFELDKSATVKAIAKKGDETSPVASKEFTLIDFANETIESLNELTENKANINLTLKDAKVTYVDEAGKKIYVREGDKALMFYQSSLPLKLNATVTGTVKVDYDNYYGIHEVKDNDFTNADALTITESTEEAQPTEVTIADLLALKHICDYVVLNKVQIVSEGNFFYAQAGEEKIQLYKGIDVSSYADNGKEYNVVAVFNNIYKGKAEVEPIKVSDWVAGIEIPVVSQKALDKNAPMYNLAGQRVGASYKGIVLQNGNKYIVK